MLKKSRHRRSSLPSPTSLRQNRSPPCKCVSSPSLPTTGSGGNLSLETRGHQTRWHQGVYENSLLTKPYLPFPSSTLSPNVPARPMDSSRQENQSGETPGETPFPTPRGHPDLGVKPCVRCISCTGRLIVYHLAPPGFPTVCFPENLNPFFFFLSVVVSFL